MPFQFCNAPGMIRTCDPLIRSQVLYPAELRVLKSELTDYKFFAVRVKFMMSKTSVLLGEITLSGA